MPESEATGEVTFPVSVFHKPSALHQKIAAPSPTWPQTAAPADAPTIRRSVARVRMATTTVMTRARQLNRKVAVWSRSGYITRFLRL